MVNMNRSALVMFSARQMYDLVNDVESYPQFLPGCSNGALIESSEYHLVAAVSVSKAGIHKTFTTRNTMEPARTIDIQLVDGPFKTLHSTWTFTPLDEQSCKVDFFIEFEFSSPLIEFAFGKIFKELTGSMVNAFIKRAKDLYGTSAHRN